MNDMNLHLLFRNLLSVQFLGVQGYQRKKTHVSQSSTYMLHVLFFSSLIHEVLEFLLSSV